MKALKTGRAELELSGQPGGRRRPLTGKRERGDDESLWLGGGRKPLEGESRTWQRGETNPQGRERSKPSRP
jgi:hypothetical protein